MSRLPRLPRAEALEVVEVRWTSLRCCCSAQLCSSHLSVSAACRLCTRPFIGAYCMSSSRSALVLGLILSGVMVSGCGGAQSRLESHLKRGQEYYDKGDYKKASVELRNALQIAPKDI